VPVSSALLPVEQQEEKMQKTPPRSFTEGFKDELVLACQNLAGPPILFSERMLWAQVHIRTL